jgi:uncharacterized protein (TIRG00374 family)
VKRHLATVAKVAVSLGLLGYLFSTTDLGALARRMGQGEPGPLLAAVLLHTGVVLLCLVRWRLLLQALGHHAPVKLLGSSYLVALFFNNFLPSNIGGDVIRVRDTKPTAGSHTAALAVVVIDRILGLAALYVLAVAAFLLGPPEVQRLVGARPALVALGIAFAGLSWVFFRPGLGRRLMAASRLDSLPWVRQRFETVQAAVNVYRARRGAVVAAVALSLVLQSLVVLFHYNVARALRIPLSLAAVFLVVPLCTLVQTVPVSFNGWGVRESVFILYFGQLGLDRDAALAFGIVGAGLVTLLSLAGAVVWLARGRPTPGESAEELAVAPR